MRRYQPREERVRGEGVCGVGSAAAAGVHAPALALLGDFILERGKMHVRVVLQGGREDEQRQEDGGAGADVRERGGEGGDWLVEDGWV